MSVHQTVKTVFINMANGEEIKELPSRFDRAALKENFTLSTHLSWRDTWIHYRVVKVEEQAEKMVVVYVKQVRLHHWTRFIAALVGLLLLVGLLALALRTFFQ